MNFAPVAIFACRRPKHLERLLNSLANNSEASETDLTIFIGGPKSEDDWNLVYNTISVAEKAIGFKSVKVQTCFELTTANQLIDYGVSSILSSSSNVIVLEDDLIVRGDFLLYMNTSLERYQADEKVAQISGWNFGVMHPGSPKETYLMSNTTSWGWATWQRAWNLKSDLIENFNWLVSRSNRIHSFNMSETNDYLGMLEAVVNDGYLAWDVCWYLDCFRENLLVLYPNSSLVINEGFDGSGLNFDFSFKWEKSFTEEPQDGFLFPEFTDATQFRSIYLRNYRNWVRASIKKRVLFPYVIARKVRQHQRYARPGFYNNLWSFRTRKV